MTNPTVAPTPQPYLFDRPKTPWVHGLLSAIVPGLGSMMAGDAPAGALFLVGLWFVYPFTFWFAPFTVAAITGSGDGTAIAFIVIFLIALGCYIYGIIRGAGAAYDWNAKRRL